MQFSTIARPNYLASAPRTTATSTTSHRKAGASLWVLQALLAATFLMAGISKLVMSAGDLTAQTDLSATFLRFIGVCEALGAVGLILPGLLKIRTGLTPLAAAGLVIIMIGATTVTIAAGDPAPAILPFIVGSLAAVVAWTRATKVALRGGTSSGRTTVTLATASTPA